MPLDSGLATGVKHGTRLSDAIDALVVETGSAVPGKLASQQCGNATISRRSAAYPPSGELLAAALRPTLFDSADAAWRPPADGRGAESATPRVSSQCASPGNVLDWRGTEQGRFFYS